LKKVGEKHEKAKTSRGKRKVPKRAHGGRQSGGLAVPLHTPKSGGETLKKDGDERKDGGGEKHSLHKAIIRRGSPGQWTSLGVDARGCTGERRSFDTKNGTLESLWRKGTKKGVQKGGGREKKGKE